MKKLLEFARGVEEGKVVLPERPNFDEVKIVLRSKLPFEVKMEILRSYKWNECSLSKKQSLMLKKVARYLTRTRTREEKTERVFAFLEFLQVFLPGVRRDVMEEIKKLGTEYWGVALLFYPELA
jgi:hypothetical protein